MPKIDRNAPCPCDSGKEYEECCGRKRSDSAPPPPEGSSPLPLALTGAPEVQPADRWKLERATAIVEKLFSQHDFASIEEANAFLQRLVESGEFQRYKPQTPLEEAQEVMYQAWRARGSQRIRLAKKALEISTDCADAYVLLAQETAKTVEETCQLYEQGVAAGECALGPQAFEEDEEDTGQFWLMTRTRPYMRARFGLAQTLQAMGQLEEAIAHCWELLRLNPDDNMGVRYYLLPLLLEVGDHKGTRKLLNQYQGDISASWAYARALLAFREKGKAARKHLEKAIEVNPIVPLFLLELVPLPDELPEFIGFGDESEAVYCAVEQIDAWHSTPGALEWIATVTSAVLEGWAE